MPYRALRDRTRPAADVGPLACSAWGTDGRCLTFAHSCPYAREPAKHKDSFPLAADAHTGAVQKVARTVRP